MTRQRVAQNVIVPPAQRQVTLTTTGVDQTIEVEASGLTRYMLDILCPQACIVDLEEGDGTSWRRVTNIDSVVLPFTTTAATLFTMRGEKYGKSLRLKIRQSTTPAAAVINIYAQ